MTTDRLAALLHADFMEAVPTHQRYPAPCSVCEGRAARLIAAGVTLAPAEGLRDVIAAFFRAYDATHLVHDVAYEGVNDAVAALRAALAQPVAPAEGHVVRDVKLLEVSIVPTDAAPGEMDEHGAWGLIQPAAPAEGLDARGECPACTEQPHIGCEYAKEPTDD